MLCDLLGNMVSTSYGHSSHDRVYSRTTRKCGLFLYQSMCQAITMKILPKSNPNCWTQPRNKTKKIKCHENAIYRTNTFPNLVKQLNTVLACHSQFSSDRMCSFDKYKPKLSLALHTLINYYMGGPGMTLSAILVFKTKSP
jgi:hypothetical protein